MYGGPQEQKTFCISIYKALQVSSILLPVTVPPSFYSVFLIVNLFWIWDVAIAVQPREENHLAVKVTEGVVRVDAID